MFTVWKVVVVCGWGGREFRQNRGEMFMLRPFLLNSDKWFFIQEEFRYTTEENCLNSNLNLIKNYSFIPFYYFVSFCFFVKTCTVFYGIFVSSAKALSYSLFYCHENTS